MRQVSTQHLPDPANHFRVFAEQRTTGRGLWKWDHYFDIYNRHFARFRNTAATHIEIGVYSGGSLEMWRDYFGPTATIIGVDIQASVRAYEAPGRGIRDWRSRRRDVLVQDVGGAAAGRHQSSMTGAMRPSTRS